MKRAFVALLAIAAGGAGASAQSLGPSDLMPPEPPSTGANPLPNGRLYPPMAGSNSSSGRALDATGGLQEGGRPSSGAVSNAGRGTAVLDAGDLVLGDEQRPLLEKVPEVHVVRKGDTLWDISNGYFRNPWYWPKLWSFNPLITNPHWIYPGDLVRLFPLGENHAETPPPATGNQPETPRFPQMRVPATGILLRQNGFVEPGELDAAATIVGSREEKILLSSLDEAYVEFKKDKPLTQGGRYTVYRVVSEVRHPETGHLLGSIVEIMGDVEVRGFGDPQSDDNGRADQRIARALITDAVNPIERGYRVGPLRRQFKLVEPVANRNTIEGMVVAALRPTKLLGSEQLVFLDRGRDDTVDVGNRFMVVRRGDGYQPQLSEKAPDDHRFPREVIAEVLVVDVRERTCTGVVTRAIKDIQVGDHVEARKGY